MFQLGLDAERLIFKRVKAGFGSKDGKKTRLKKLSRSYVDFRKGNVFFFTRNNKVIPAKPKSGNRPRLGVFGKPGKSNLTFSGQLLNAQVVNANQTGFKISVRRSSRRGDNKTNQQVQEIVEAERPYFSLTRDENRIIEKKWTQIVRKELDKLLRKVR